MISPNGAQQSVTEILLDVATLCPRCKVSCNNDRIFCVGCQKSFHYQCKGLSRKKYLEILSKKLTFALYVIMMNVLLVIMNVQLVMMNVQLIKMNVQLIMIDFRLIMMNILLVVMNVILIR